MSIDDTIKALPPNELLDTISAKIQQHITQFDSLPLLIGIHTAGVWVAEAVQQRIGFSESWALNVNYQRDDFHQRGLAKTTKLSNMPTSIEGKHVILIDDVIYTGRTVRAAINELFDYGRPASIAFVALLDRGGRQLPICADIIGKKISLHSQQRIKLKQRNNMLIWEIQSF